MFGALTTKQADVSFDPVLKAAWLQDLNDRLELHARAHRLRHSNSTGGSEAFAEVTAHDRVFLEGAFGHGMNAEAACTSRVYECVLPLAYFFDGDDIDDGLSTTFCYLSTKAHLNAFWWGVGGAACWQV